MASGLHLCVLLLLLVRQASAHDKHKRPDEDFPELPLTLRVKQDRRPIVIKDRSSIAPKLEPHPNGVKVEDLTIMVGMIGRDVSRLLPYTLHNLWRLSALFKHMAIVLVENDSSDATRADFHAFFRARGSDKLSGEILSLPPSVAEKFVGFTKKNLDLLAEARNVYLEALREPRYKNVDYVLSVDTDMCFPWNINNIKETLDAFLPVSGTEWVSLHANGICGWYDWYEGMKGLWGHEVLASTPNSRPRYCDRWALWVNSTRIDSALMWISPLSFGMGTCDTAYPRSAIDCHVVNGQAAIRVLSAFGGFAFYRADVLRRTECRYGTVNGGLEHDKLGFCLLSYGYQALIAPKMIINWEGCYGPVKDEMEFDVPLGYYEDRFPSLQDPKRRALRGL